MIMDARAICRLAAVEAVLLRVVPVGHVERVHRPRGAEGEPRPTAGLGAAATDAAAAGIEELCRVKEALAAERDERFEGDSRAHGFAGEAPADLDDFAADLGDVEAQLFRLTAKIRTLGGPRRRSELWSLR